MLRSKVFKLVDVRTQKSLHKDIREWIYIAKQDPGVHSYLYGDRTYYLISLGERPNPGYNIELEKVEETDEKIAVYIKEIFPSPGGFYPTVITYPYLLVEAEKPLEVWIVKDQTASLFFP